MTEGIKHLQKQVDFLYAWLLSLAASSWQQCGTNFVDELAMAWKELNSRQRKEHNKKTPLKLTRPRRGKR